MKEISKKQLRRTAKKDKQRFNKSDLDVSADRSTNQLHKEAKASSSQQMRESDIKRIPKKQQTASVNTHDAKSNDAKSRFDDVVLSPNHDPLQYEVTEEELQAQPVDATDQTPDEDEQEDESEEEDQPDASREVIHSLPIDWASAWRRPTKDAQERADFIILSDRTATPYVATPLRQFPMESVLERRMREFANLLHQMEFLSHGEQSYMGRIVLQATTPDYRTEREDLFYKYSGISLNNTQRSRSLSEEQQDDSLYHHAYGIQLEYEAQCHNLFQEFIALIADAKGNMQAYMPESLSLIHI